MISERFNSQGELDECPLRLCGMHNLGRQLQDQGIKFLDFLIHSHSEGVTVYLYKDDVTEKIKSLISSKRFTLKHFEDD